jgi:hypothetical protein
MNSRTIHGGLILPLSPRTRFRRQQNLDYLGKRSLVYARQSPELRRFQQFRFVIQHASPPSPWRLSESCRH